MLSDYALMRRTIDNYMESFEVCFPAIIDAVNDDGTVDILPSCRNCLSNMQIDAMDNVIKGVPALQLGNSDVCVEIELKKGDPVLAFSASRDLTKFKNSDWKEAPFDPTSYAGSDLNSLLVIPLRTKTFGGAESKITIRVKHNDVVEVISKKVNFTSDSVSITGDLKVDGKINVKGDLTSDANVKASGAMSADGEVTANAKTLPIQLSMHKHPSAMGPTGPATP